MKVTFWGTRGSIPVPGKDTTFFGGNTTCLELTLAAGNRIVIDAGTGIRLLGESLVQAREPVDVLLLMTHIHWDHVMGFPFFDPLYFENTRVSLDGFPTCTKGLKATFDNGMGDGFFPVHFNDLKADIRYLDTLNNGPLHVGEAVIDVISLQHPQGAYGFRFREAGKTLVFMTDNELTDAAWKGRHADDFMGFCEGADVLIHDAQYTPEEIPRRKGWGHSDYISCLQLALKAQVGRLILFHHDPTRTDAQVATIRAACEQEVLNRGLKMPVEAAREGSTLLV